jgi:hypothetical protein
MSTVELAFVDREALANLIEELLIATDFERCDCESWRELASDGICPFCRARCVISEAREHRR